MNVSPRPNCHCLISWYCKIDYVLTSKVQSLSSNTYFEFRFGRSYILGLCPSQVYVERIYCHNTINGYVHPLYVPCGDDSRRSIVNAVVVGALVAAAEAGAAVLVAVIVLVVGFLSWVGSCCCRHCCWFTMVYRYSHAIGFIIFDRHLPL